MRTIFKKLGFLALGLALCVTPALADDDYYDIVLKGGRVMDPETSLDAIMNVGIIGDRIMAVTTDELSGEEVIDVKGLVVAPGFIDTHQHSLDLFDGRLAASDGVTTHMELEFGRHPVSEAYDIIKNRGGHAINYGFSAGWPSARGVVMAGVKSEATWVGLGPTFEAPWGTTVATKEQIKQLLALLQKDLDDGALGIGYPPAYGPGAGTQEAFQIWQLAAANNVPVSVHVRFESMLDPNSSVTAMNEMLGYAAASGARAILCHIQLLGLSDPYLMLELIQGGRDAGLKLTTEVYPFGTTAPPISAAYLQWKNADKRIGFEWDQIQTAAHYHFKDEADFRKMQKDSPITFVHIPYIDESTTKGRAAMRAAVTFPNTIPSADGTPISWPGKPKDPETLGLGSGVDVWPVPSKGAEGDPRTASVHSVIFGKWVRERGALTLMQAISNSSYVPSRDLGEHIPQFKTKGRLQVGMDADITVFDPKTVKANATWEKIVELNTGFYYTIVNGQFILKDGEINTKILPGRQIRRTKCK